MRVGEITGLRWCDVEINGYADFVFLNRFGGLQHQGTLNRVYKRIIRDCIDAAYSWASDITTTMDIYTDATQEIRDDALEVFEKYIRV